MEPPLWLKEMLNRRWGLGAAQDSITRKGKSIAIYSGGGKLQVEDGDYLINWEGNPLRMSAGFFESLFEEKNGRPAKKTD